MSVTLLYRSQVTKTLRTLVYSGTDERVFREVQPTGGVYTLDMIRNFASHAPWCGVSVQRVEAYREGGLPFARIFTSLTCVVDDQSRQQLYRDDTVLTVQEQLLVALMDPDVTSWGLPSVDPELPYKAVESTIARIVYTEAVDGAEVAICELQFTQDVGIYTLRLADLNDLESVVHDINDGDLVGQVGLT